MSKYTNIQRYVLAGLLAGGYIMKSSRATSSWGISAYYEFIGPDGEKKCTVNVRTVERFVAEGIIKEQSGKWVSAITPTQEAK